MLRRASILGWLLGAWWAAAAGELALDSSIVAGRTWAVGAAEYREQLEKAVSSRRLPDAETIGDLVGKYALCKMLSTARGRGWNRGGQDDQVLREVLANPPLAYTLALALRPKDDPARALRVLGAALRACKKRGVAAPELCVAFAVVWDSRLTQPPPPPRKRGKPRAETEQEAWLRRLCAHFLSVGRRTRPHVARLPWQLAVFAVDSALSVEERQWAVARYGGLAAYRKLYDAVPDDPHRRALARGIAYTVDNILAHGGSSVDRAYFAANVAKACGRPCIQLRGPTRIGVDHAWVLELTTGGRYQWAAHGPTREPMGSYVDPQTGQTRSLSDARLLARAMSLAPGHRSAADAYYRAAEMLHGSASAAHVLALLEQAARKNPYDPRPWLMLSEMMARKEAAYKKAGTLYRYLLAKFKGYPHFTRDILHALLPLIPEDQALRRKRLYEATFHVYRANPDVAVGLMMELAGYLHRRRKTRAAMATYRAIVKRYRAQGHLVEQALQSAEGIYRRHGMLPQAIEMYEQVYRAYRDKEADAVAHGRDAFVYRFAQKLAQLHREAGNEAKAAEYDAIRERIDDDIKAALRAAESRDRRGPHLPRRPPR